MSKVLTNYCYSWYRTKRRTNVLSRTNALTEEATADQRERVYRTNVLTEEATADPRKRADRRASADRIV